MNGNEYLDNNTIRFKLNFSTIQYIQPMQYRSTVENLSLKKKKLESFNPNAISMVYSVTEFRQYKLGLTIKDVLSFRLEIFLTTCLQLKNNRTASTDLIVDVLVNNPDSNFR